MKKLVSLLLVLIMTVTLPAGCGNKKSAGGNKEEKKEKVVVALWGNDLLENYTQYLCKSFPQVEFEFILATNSTDYYRYRYEHDDMPDILTVRRFSLKDAVLLKDYLYDLSNTELAATYHGTYLDNYTYDDGTVNWLPACAEVDSIIINKTLFEEYNVPIPTDYNSFLAACKAFEKVGIRGFISDFGADYTCMETLQGFSIAQLLSMEGREWRQKYESDAIHQLSEEVWMPVFEKFFDLKEKTGLGKAETAMQNRDPKNLYMQGKLAMYRGTGNDVIIYPGREGDESLLLPYFGDDEQQNWYLTYPAFQVAASAKGMKNPEREALILEIMTAMLNQEGQNHISYGKNMVPYNKNVSLDLLPGLENLKPYIDQNKMYIRLASNEMFSISKSVVQKILLGELTTPKEAFDAFNALLTEKKTAAPAVAHIGTAYSNEFTPKHGNQAASVICNTVRVETGVDLMFAQACYISGDIYTGDYTQKELDYLTKNDGGWPVVVQLTGEQVYRLVELSLVQKESRGVVCNDSTLYVSSGFEMDITKNETGYMLNGLTKDGKELDQNAVYSVFILSDRDWVMDTVMKTIGCKEYDDSVGKYNVYLTNRLVEKGGQLEAPTDYITLR